MKFYFQHRGNIHLIEWQGQDQGYTLLGDHDRHLLEFAAISENQVSFKLDGVEKQARWLADGRKIWLHIDGRTHLLERRAGLGQDGDADAITDRTLRAPMPGQVKDVAVIVDQQVQSGDLLLTMEAMKMELRIEAPFPNARIQYIIEKGASVEKDQILVELEPEEN